MAEDRYAQYRLPPPTWPPTPATDAEVLAMLQQYRFEPIDWTGQQFARMRAEVEQVGRRIARIETGLTEWGLPTVQVQLVPLTDVVDVTIVR